MFAEYWPFYPSAPEGGKKNIKVIVQSMTFMFFFNINFHVYNFLNKLFSFFLSKIIIKVKVYLFGWLDVWGFVRQSR